MRNSYVVSPHSSQLSTDCKFAFPRLELPAMTTSEELQELQEHAEHAQHDRSLAPVSLTMAVLAVLVATVSLLGHRSHTEEVILQNKATDQWAYYQAKNIRRHTDELFADLSSVMARLMQQRQPNSGRNIRQKQKAMPINKKKSMQKQENWSRRPDTNATAPTATTWQKSFWRSGWW